MNKPQGPKRVAVYIDGFNLYYGLKDKGWKRYYWLNVSELATRLVRPGEQVVQVHYFTARVRPTSSKQSSYLEALGTVPDIKIHYGKFLKKTRKCPACAHVHPIHEEKMTDVNIALALVLDAEDDIYDRAILISADSDLTRPISTVHQRCPSKEVFVAFPPKRSSNGLKGVAKNSFHINRQHVSQSQLPQTLVTNSGHTVTQPPDWR